MSEKEKPLNQLFWLLSSRCIRATGFSMYATERAGACVSHTLASELTPKAARGFLCLLGGGLEKCIS
jgi:hypothetical protein